MKSILPWFCLAAIANVAYAEDGFDYYRLGNYDKAANLLIKANNKNPVVDFYMAKMQLYGYGIIKNNDMAIHNFELAAAKGLLSAQQIMARYELLETNNLEKALYWFKKAADKDDIDAMMYCAAAYYYGIGVKPNKDMAQKYYIVAARNGNSIAEYSLARNFLQTKHMVNKKLGMIWLNKSLAQNNPAAQILMAKQYIDGKMVEKDLSKARELINLSIAQNYLPAYYQMGNLELLEDKYEEAKKWYLKAADSEYLPAMISLSNLYGNEKSPFFDSHESYLWMLKAAQNGSRKGSLELAKMYEKGFGIAADLSLAQSWQKKSNQSVINPVEKAKIDAVHWLTGRKYSKFSDTTYNLRGILSSWSNPNFLKQNNYNKSPQMETIVRENIYKPNFKLVDPNLIPISEYYDILLSSQKGTESNHFNFPNYTIPIISKSPEQDNILKNKLIASLGFDYLLQQVSSSSSINYQEVFKNLIAKAEIGDNVAQFDVGLMYQQGLGVEKDIDAAIKYYKLAAEQDNLASMYNLAMIYLLGSDGVAADYKLAEELLNDAAFKGNAFAEYTLAQIYENGYKNSEGQDVIAKNLDQAIAMYNIAAANNFGLAEYRLAEIMVHTQPTDISVDGKYKRNELIKELYAKALVNNVPEARLPLAFYNAMDQSKQKQQLAYDACKKDAESGNKNAALLLGLMYDRGIVVDSNKSQAIEWYEKSGDNPVAAFILGTIRANGDGLSKDVNLAQQLLQKAVVANFSYANLNMAVLKKQSNEEFLPYLSKSLAEGNSIAGLLLADYYLSQSQDDLQLKSAHAIYNELAAKGDKDAQLKLAFLYENGIGGNVDFLNAEKWYQQAADQGHPVAQYLLARLYQLGKLAIGPDYTLAKKWYQQAAGKYTPAAVALGFLYDTEDENYQNAMTEYKIADAKGDIIGAFNLGLLYERGEGCVVDYNKARDLYLKAAKVGHKEAMVQLAGLYLNGYGVSVDSKEAFNWYEKAAKKGDREAMYQLGLMYEKGIAIKLDDVTARQYYKKAADLGNEKANLALARLYPENQGKSQEVSKSTEDQDKSPS